MVEGDMELALVIMVIAPADEMYAVIVGSMCKIELAPGYGDIVGPSGYVNTTVIAVNKGALGDEDIVYIFFYGDAVTFAIATGRGDIQSFNDYIGRTIFKADLSYDCRIFTYTLDSFV
jgi:hypothetical protein